MKKFIINIFCFIILGLLIGEVISRKMALTSDIPQRIIDENGIQKYKPYQKGQWLGGGHSWQINYEGWPGELPNSYYKLVTLIGDSYIENFMNPNQCHQAAYLSELMPQFNYFEAARSGVSFIEAMEISKSLDSFQPEAHIIYVHDSDFSESIMQIQRFQDRTQLDLTAEKLVPGRLKSPGAKKILYNWKFMYYLYNRFPMNIRLPELWKKEVVSAEKKQPNNKYEDYKQLLDYVARTYYTADKILVFAPNSDHKLISLVRESGFNILKLVRPDDENWSFDYDPHWNCYGHKRVAQQVAKILMARPE